MGRLLLFIWVCRGAVSGAVSAVIPSEAATWQSRRISLCGKRSFDFGLRPPLRMTDLKKR